MLQGTIMSGMQVDLEVMQNRTKFAICQGIYGQGQLVRACPVRVAVQLVYTGSLTCNCIK